MGEVKGFHYGNLRRSDAWATLDIGLRVIHYHPWAVPVRGTEKNMVVVESERATLLGDQHDIDE